MQGRKNSITVLAADSMIIEACVETLDEALAAEANGATQIELCADLDQDGLTPSFDLIREVNRQLKIPVKVMIRPRTGNFIYSDDETVEMKAAIDYCKMEQVHGVVFGVTNSNDELDLVAIADLVRVSFPLQVTIHKAVDITKDPIASATSLSSIPGIHSILTSGKSATAGEGASTIREMIQAAGEKIMIIAAGRITDQNLSSVHAQIGAGAYHGRLIVSKK